MMQKLQNSKGYAELPEFLPVLGLFIFKKKSITTAFARLQFFCSHSYIYMYILYIYTRTPTRSHYPVRLCAGGHKMILYQSITNTL